MKYFILVLLALPQEARDLIEKLRSDRVEDRDDATRRLKDVGRAALGELDKASQDRDVEVAGRARGLARLIRNREILTDRLLKAFPGIEERLAWGDDHAWTVAFLEAVQSPRRPGPLESDDFGHLAPAAVRGAATLEEKERVCEAVQGRNVRAAIPEIANLLKDPDDSVRILASSTLRGLKAKEAIPRIVGLLQHPDGGVRLRSVDLLPWLDAKESVPAVTRLLADREGGVRGIAASALARLEGRAATPKFLLVLKLDPAPWVRLQAAYALVSVLEKQAIPAIARLLEDRDATVRKGAVEMLCLLSAREGWTEIAKRLRDENAEVRLAAVQARFALDLKRCQEELLPLAKDPSDPVREMVATALGRCASKQAVPGLRGLLTDSNAVVRCNAAESLGLLGGREALPDLFRLLDDKEPNVRDMAAAVLGWMEAQEAAPRIARLLKEESRREVREGMLGLLADLGFREAVPQIRDLLEDPEPDVVKAALEALGSLGGREAIPRIQRFLDHPREDLSMSAVLALSDLRAMESVPALLKLLDRAGNDASTEDAICWALVNMGAMEAAPRLASFVRSRGNKELGSAVAALGCLESKEAIPDLITLLQDARTLLPAYAAWGLAELNAKEAGPAIAGLLKRGGGNARVAAQALGKLDARNQIPAIIEALSRAGESDQSAFARALAILGSSEGVPVLLGKGPTLSELNALRRRESWDALDRKRITQTPRGLSMDVFLQHVEKETGLAIDWGDNPYRGLGMLSRVMKRSSMWTARLTIPEALDRVLEGDHFEFILEPGKIRVLPHDEALKFWRAWWEAERKK